MCRRLRSKKKEIEKSNLPDWKPNPDKYIALLEREYGLSREDILWDNSWEDVQFRVNQIPIDRVVPWHNGYKKGEYRIKYLESLCDRKTPKEIKENLKSEYEIFQAELDRVKGVKTS